MEKQFDDFPSAFDYCRELNRPVTVLVKGERWKLFPSGHAERFTLDKLAKIRQERKQ